jgi:glucose-1-phosphate thymidylyltransferase
MKGIILAAGKGKRLYPLTSVFPKPLLPVYDRPMIYHAINQLRNAGITDIAVVISPEHEAYFRTQLADEGITLVPQYEQKGTAHALLQTEPFADGDSIAVIHGDNIMEDQLDVSDFSGGGLLHLIHTDTPERGGVVVIEDGKIIDFEEKPKNPRSNLMAIGCYVYENDVYRYLKKVIPSPRGELEATDVHKTYIQQGRMQYRILEGPRFDCGTYDTLLAAGEWMRSSTSGAPD